MKICIVAEGCYPYVVGGVSSWIHSMIRLFPNAEFIILSIVANRSMSGKFAYELGENLVKVQEVYLEDFDWIPSKKSGRRTNLSKEEYRALRSLMLNQTVDWNVLFDLFHSKKYSVDDILMGADFLRIVEEHYKRSYPHITFSDFLWTLRSMYLPLFLTLNTDVPQADLYHCICTGYAGILGCMGKYFHNSSLLISEHGIYTREREEEIIKATWVESIYKNIWIDQFKKMSRVAYQWADKVTCLYDYAKTLQIELGCPANKIVVTPNGIDIDRLKDLPGKQQEDKGMINIGAVLRVAPIKDVKTMIQAFSYAKAKVPNLKLWIMGPWDEEKEYAEECFELVEVLGVQDVVFTGRIDVKDYLGRMDMTILTSISEGQPLTVLESYAAKKPVICTDVGCCRELIYGSGDNLGTAGILTHIMNVEEIANAMEKMALNEQLRISMGENGYQRVNEKYAIEDMRKKYDHIYHEFAVLHEKEWTIKGEETWQE